MAVADHIVDSISSTNNNNNNSNNNGEFDDDLKRVSEVLESSKACVFSNPTFFLYKKNFPAPPNVHQNEALKKTSSAGKNLKQKKNSYTIDCSPVKCIVAAATSTSVFSFIIIHICTSKEFEDSICSYVSSRRKLILPILFKNEHVKVALFHVTFLKIFQ